MRLINNSQAIPFLLSKSELCGGLIRRHRDSPDTFPFVKSRGTGSTVNLRDAQTTKSSYLPAPILQNTRRADHYKSFLSDISQRHHGGNGLNRFTKAHLIAKKRLLLMKDVFDSPLLIATQRTKQPVWEKILILNFTGKVLWQSK